MKKLSVYVLSFVFIFGNIENSFSMSSGGCIEQLLVEIKNNLNNQSALKRLCLEHLGYPFTQRILGHKWNKLSQSERQNKTIDVCSETIRLSSRLAQYANVKIKWKGNLGYFKYDGENYQMRLYPAPGSCKFYDIGISDYGTLANIIKPVIE